MCNHPLSVGRDGQKKIHLCLQCNKLYDYTPTKRNKNVDGVKEYDIQKAILKQLRSLGYLCLSTTEHRKACLKCGTYDHRGSGIDRGVGDVLVRASWYPDCFWAMLEIKKPSGTLQKEQKELHEQGAIAIARSVDEAIYAIKTIEANLLHK